METNRPRALVIVPCIGAAALWVACGGGTGGGGTDSGPGGPETTSADGESPADPGEPPDLAPGDSAFSDRDAVEGGTDAPGEVIHPDVAGDPGAWDTPEVFLDPKCNALASGTVSGFDVDGTPRTFLLHLPAGVTGSPAGSWPCLVRFG